MKWIGRFVLAVGVVLILWVGLVMRFQNPDWTSTRLFIETWPACLLAVACLFVGGCVLLEAENRR